MAERQFGPYRLVQQIASGGMAEIHLARTRGIAGFEKVVALKMIHPNFSSDEHFVHMLVDEAKLTVLLQHVNIVQVFDLGRVGDTFYITMEFVDGVDLYKILRSASEIDLPMPIEVAVHIAREVCAGLEYAHAKTDDMGTPLGIVHRDVSPQNILISHSGEVKVVDFGIAKAASRAKQTAVGVIKGKYYYMSPEQSWGDPLDHRTDVFSAGILLYEMLAGQMLYLEEDLHKLLDMVRKADIAPITSKRRDVPPELEKIVMRALARKPEQRYQTALDFQVALDQFLRRRAPDFTTGRLTTFVRRSLGMADEEVWVEERAPEAPITEPPITEPRPRVTAPTENVRPPTASSQRLAHTPTRSLHRDDILLREEFHDENSVIFNAEELRRVHEAARPSAELRAHGSRTAAAELDVALTPARVPRRRGAAAALPASHGEPEDEATMLATPPRLDASTSGPLDQEEDAPTRIELSAGSFARELASRPPTGGSGTSQGAAPASRRARRTPGLGVPERDEATLLGSSPRVPTPSPRAPSASPFAHTQLADRGGPRVPPAQVTSQRLPVSHAVPPLPTPPPPLAIAPVAITPAPPGYGGGPIYVADAQGWQPPGGLAPRWDGAPEPGDPGRGGGELRTSFRELLGSRRVLGAIAILIAVSGLVAGLVAGLSTDPRPPSGPTAIEVVSIPEGATVFLDDQRKGATRLTLGDLEPGDEYTLRVELEKHEPWTSTQTALEGKTVKVIAPLKPIMGTLRVESSPNGAEVFFGPQSLGRTPLVRDNVDPFLDGTIEVRLRGYRPERQRLEWGGKRDAALTFKLLPLRE